MAPFDALNASGRKVDRQRLARVPMTNTHTIRGPSRKREGEKVDMIGG
jgi:hypothetical protein